jgi:folate-binding protein YgfZ
MSPQVTFKSTEDKLPQGGAPAPRLADAVARTQAPSHGSAPRELPQPPVGLLDLGPAPALRVTGPDREKWLQGMQTNDLGAAPFGGAVGTLFLAGRGRIVSDGLVWRFPEELIVVADRMDVLHPHLDKLLIMEDCELERVDGLRRLRYCPGNAPPAADAPGSWQPLGFEMLLPEAEAQRLLEKIPARVDPDRMEAWRIAVGMPRLGVDYDEDATPIEAGLDQFLSFDKGCYVGQEVVAMATYRGRVSWNLVRLEVGGEAPAPGTRIDPSRAAGAGKRGRVTSSTQVADNGVFLGYVHKELIVPGSQVALEDGRTATVLGLPNGSKPGAGVCA